MKIFLVGGAIRDRLLNLPLKDKDWVIIGSTPEELIKQGFKPVGKDFPVFLHPISGEEYALARTEKKSGRGYRGFTCYTSPDITLEQDLYRRDLTINAIACDAQGKYYDPFNGSNDIFNRRLRHISNAFSEDPLRVLRVARFAACYDYLNFKIAPETLTLMRYMSDSGDLNYLSAERVWKETEISLRSRNPILYFQILRECHALSFIFPEIDTLYEININSNREINWLDNSSNSSCHPLLSLSLAVRISHQLEVRFASLCHDVGQLVGKKNSLLCHQKSTALQFPHISNREKMKLVDKFCHRLRVPKCLRNFSLLANKWNFIVHKIEEVESNSIITLFNQIDAWRKPHRLSQIAAVSQAVNYQRQWTPILEDYPQVNYLRKIFLLASQVSVKQVIKDGYQGYEIHKELDRRRGEAIKFWKKDI
ncbi:MAG: multifunctional CCA addition/repair protein [Candidatus Dasytiphilus stammeri]